MVFAEDLNLKGLCGGMLAKHCLDAAWGSFLDILKWVAWKRGVYFARVDARGTSQTCPNCGADTGKKELSSRVHKCNVCNYETDRDVAAAQVVMQRGYTAVGQTAVLALGGRLPGSPREAASPNREEGKPAL